MCFSDPYQKTWETEKVTADKCGYKCDGKATCACGLVYGDYKCSCPLGMYGAGGSGDCTRKLPRYLIKKLNLVIAG